MMAKFEILKGAGEPDFHKIIVSQASMNLDSRIIEALHRADNYGQKYIEKKREFRSEVGIDETGPEKKAREAAEQAEDEQRIINRARDIEHLINAEIAVNLLNKVKNEGRTVLRDDERQWLKRYGPILQNPSGSTFTKEPAVSDNQNDGEQEERDPPSPYDSNDMMPVFHAPAYMTTGNDREIYENDARHYYEEHHRSAFAAKLSGIKRSIKQGIIEVIRSARAKSKLANVGKTYLLLVSVPALGVMGVDFALWNHFALAMLHMSTEIAALISLASIVIAERVGVLMFKPALLKSLKSGTWLAFKGKNLIIGMALAMALSLGLSLFTENKIKQEQREITLEVVLNGAEPRPVSQVLVSLNTISTMVSQTLLGMLVLLFSGLLFSMLVIIGRIVGKKTRLNKARDSYDQAIAAVAELIHIRQEGIRMAACINGLSAVYKSKKFQYHK